MRTVLRRNTNNMKGHAHGDFVLDGNDLDMRGMLLRNTNNMKGILRTWKS